jgi:hypothetical protein
VEVIAARFDLRAPAVQISPACSAGRGRRRFSPRWRVGSSSPWPTCAWPTCAWRSRRCSYLLPRPMPPTAWPTSPRRRCPMSHPWSNLIVAAFPLTGGEARNNLWEVIRMHRWALGCGVRQPPRQGTDGHRDQGLPRRYSRHHQLTIVAALPVDIIEQYRAFRRASGNIAPVEEGLAIDSLFFLSSSSRKADRNYCEVAQESSSVGGPAQGGAALARIAPCTPALPVSIV